MKAICICTSGRMEFLEQCLNSLLVNDLEGWTVYLSCEPAVEGGLILGLLDRFKNIPVAWWVNGKRLGPELNTFTVCFTAINDDAQALLYLDDDMVLSPDAIELCNWYLSDPENCTIGKTAGICLCNDVSEPDRPASISPNDTWRGLVGQGYCYTRAQWFDFVKRNFWVYFPFFGGDGYDWALGHMAVHLKKRILRPRMSRSRHIGAYGHHGGKVFPEHISDHTGLNFVIENE